MLKENAEVHLNLQLRKLAVGLDEWSYTDREELTARACWQLPLERLVSSGAGELARYCQICSSDGCVTRLATVQ